MCCGDASISSVDGMEATFLWSGIAIGEGSTPVVVGGGYSFIVVVIHIVSECISGSIGRRIGHGWLIALLLRVLCWPFFLAPVGLSDRSLSF